MVVVPSAAVELEVSATVEMPVGAESVVITPTDPVSAPAVEKLVATSEPSTDAPAFKLPAVEIEPATKAPVTDSDADVTAPGDDTLPSNAFPATVNAPAVVNDAAVNADPNTIQAKPNKIRKNHWGASS
jgi:hypothetical protein